jgi:hypothetical protein
MKTRKLTPKDEFLKLDGLVNDKEVNECIEENCITRRKEIADFCINNLDNDLTLEQLADLQIMTDRNEALKKSADNSKKEGNYTSARIIESNIEDVINNK